MAAVKRLNDTYVLLEQIGAGSNGVVYKAWHTRLQIYVAVKKIRERVKGRLSETAEADLLKNMKHTCLPRVYDIFRADGDVYTVIDFIPGESLDRVLAREGRISQKRVLKWANQLADALAYLHGMNPPVIHSDIKPSNIMLTPEDNICLIDFNISLALDRSSADSIGVTYGYSPPEQYRLQSQRAAFQRTASAGVGRASRWDADPTELPDDRTETSADDLTSTADVTWTSVGAFDRTELSRESAIETTAPPFRPFRGGIDTRSDIYSLGATLYHLLTGVKPPRDFSRIVPIERCCPELSEGFAHIISKMMALDPDSRYRDGGELLQALRNIHELDSEYCRWRRNQRIRKGICAALIAAGVLLLCAGRLQIFREKNIRYSELILSSEEAMDSGAYEEASAMLEEAQELLPRSAEAYGEQVYLLYLSGDYEACISYAEEVLRTAPYSLEEDASVTGDIYHIIGTAYIETEEYGTAVSYLETAIEYYDGESQYYRDYAIALAGSGNPALAEETLETAIELGLGEDSIYMVQGEIAYAEQEYDEAMTCFEKAIDYAQSVSLRRRAVLLCDRVYRMLGTEYIDEEIEMLEQEAGLADSLTVSERLADAYVRKAESSEEYAEEYYEKALAVFEEIYNTGYVTAQLMENIAILYENLDRFDEAEDILLAMAERYPDDYTAYMRLAYLEADRQQEEENADRDYTAMADWYAQALALYDEDENDLEMQMLEVMMQEVSDGGWLD